MADDPMITNPEVYSVNTFTGNGTQTVWELNFSGGFISRDHIKAFTTAADGSITIVAFTWTGPNTVQVTPAVATGTSLTVYRDTPKSSPVVDFVGGSILNEPNLDTLAKQAVFVGAEMVDRFARFATLAQEAKTLADAAVTIAQATVGGDFTAFARTNATNPFTASQTFSAGVVIGSNAFSSSGQFRKGVGAFADIYTTADFTIGNYSTTAQVSTQIGDAAVLTLAAAATDATTKAATAQAAAIANATAQVNTLRSDVDADWLYTLASR